MKKNIVVVRKNQKTIQSDENKLVITLEDFLAKKIPTEFLSKPSSVRIINLCNDYDYLSTGYYCSLLAEARGNKVIPSVNVMLELNWKRIYQSSLSEINNLLQSLEMGVISKEINNETPIKIYFGRTGNRAFSDLARKIFDIFRFPLLELNIKLENNKPEVSSIEYVSVFSLDPSEEKLLEKYLNIYVRSSWSNEKKSKNLKYNLAILHDPNEKFAPSDKEALEKFVKIGEEMDIQVDLITRKDQTKLLEYDALFIRETTAVNHHTYRISKKAEAEGIPVIDDSTSIARCTNKVYLAELLESSKIPTPATYIFDKSQFKELSDKIEYPIVVKIPDGCFSLGVHKVSNKQEFGEVTKKMFEDSDILLAQEFMKTDFDWRIGVLNGEPVYACKYFMVENHWQIYEHKGSDNSKTGKHVAYKINEVPKDIIDTAVKATKLIGSGLYGVDMKEFNGKPVVIEVNDNPNIDADVEDEILGDELYRKIFAEFIRRIDL